MMGKLREKFKLGVWNVGIIDSKVEDLLENTAKLSVRWVKHKYRDRFFADPFLYSKDENSYYILVEEFPFYENRGFISLLTVDRRTMRLTKKEKLIEESWHLSYPIVYDGKIVPEAYRSGKVFAYDFKEPNSMPKEEIFPSGLIDQTFLHYDGYEWIFATDKENPLAGLKIFYRKDNESWVPHKLNPVKTDIKNSRPGGNFFVRNGRLFRPVQDSEECYGRRIRIMQIDSLTTDNFAEHEVAVFDSDTYPPYNKAFHTFNVEDSFVVVDGYREYTSFFIKPMCLKLPKIMRKLGEKR